MLLSAYRRGKGLKVGTLPNLVTYYLLYYLRSTIETGKKTNGKVSK